VFSSSEGQHQARKSERGSESQYIGIGTSIAATTVALSVIFTVPGFDAIERDGIRHERTS